MNRLTLSLLLFAAVVSVSFANYNEKIAAELAHASYGSYCDADVIKSFKCGKSCDFLAGYSGIDHKLYELSYKHTISYSTFLNTKEKRVVVAFRGTSNVIQLAGEFTKSAPSPCNLCKTPGAKVNTYFLTYYDSVFKTEFIAAMKAAVKTYAGYDFYITGHSLGGAFATIAALHLAVEGVVPKDKLYLYTFGSPRVGNRVFARAVTANVKYAFRIVHDKDVVPHIPPCLSHDKVNCLPPEVADDANHDHQNFYGWHISPEILYNADFTSYKVCTKEEDPTCSNSFSYTSLSVSDHKLYLGASNGCKKKLFNLRLPSMKEIKDFFDDDDITKEEAKTFIKNILG